MRVRLIVGDQQSAEFEQLRRSYNNLLRVLENIASQVGGNIPADSQSAFDVLNGVISTGDDASGSGGVGAYVGTDNEILGLRPTPTPVRKAQANAPVQEDDGFDR
jgi:hypothetical protein